MAFKKMEEVNKVRHDNKFILSDDKDWAKVVPLYRDYSDVVLIDCHYIKSDEYNGYVHCLEDGCPACQRGVRLQSKLFIPLYVIADLNDNKYNEDKVVFWDRNATFDHQLQKGFFKGYDNPSTVVYEIVRNGAYKDINTTYSINGSLRLSKSIFDKVDEMGISFPEYYDTICRQYDAVKLSELLSSSNSDGSKSNLPQAELNYEVKPRAVVDPATIAEDALSADDLPVLNADAPFELKTETESVEAAVTEEIDVEPEF